MSDNVDDRITKLMSAAEAQLRNNDELVEAIRTGREVGIQNAVYEILVDVAARLFPDLVKLVADSFGWLWNKIKGWFD